MNSEQRKGGVQVQAVARAIEIIDCFRDEVELGISEISEKTGLNKSTAFGLVNTLACYGYLEQTPGRKKYRLGITLMELGLLMHSRMGVYNLAHDACLALADRYGAIVHTAIPRNSEVMYIDKIDRRSFMIGISDIGKRNPMYCTGVGKAILAFLPEEYVINNFPAVLRSRTANTITSREVLLEELKKIRECGIAMDDEEFEMGLSCIAAPVFGKNKVPQMAISLSFPNGSIKDVDQEKVRRDLLDCTGELSFRAGYQG